MRRRRVLIALRWMGGIRTFCKYVYPRFRKGLFSFTLMAPDNQAARLLLSELSPLDVEFLPLVDSRSYLRDNLGTISRAILSGDYALVHSHGVGAGLACALPARAAGTPHLMTVHDYYLPEHFAGWRGRIRQATVNAFSAAIDRVHAVSGGSRENIRAMFPRCRAKITVVPNGIDVEHFMAAPVRDLREEFGWGEERFIVGFLGRFMNQKGFPLLVRAVKELQEISLPRQVVVVAVGEGGFIREEQRRIRDLGLGDSFVFLPFIPDIAPVLKGLDVVVMPSRWETAGLLAMETLAAGTPLIASDVPGMIEFISETPARVFPSGSVEHLAGALREELLHPSRREARAYRSSAARRFDVRAQASGLESLFLEMARA